MRKNARRSTSGSMRGVVGERQDHEGGGSLGRTLKSPRMGSGADLDAAIVLAHDLLGEGEPQTRAVGFGGVERLEGPPGGLGIDASATVPKLQAHHIPLDG